MRWSVRGCGKRQAPGADADSGFPPHHSSQLVGAFELNNISIEFPVGSATDGEEGGHGDDEDDDDEFEGTGVFPLLACLNHSCTPNAAVHFPHQQATAAVVALRDIEVRRRRHARGGRRMARPTAHTHTRATGGGGVDHFLRG